MSSFVRLMTVCIGTVALLARTATAQEAVNYASIAGRVTDAQHAVLPGATVTVRHVETDVTATGATDSGGRFRFGSLRIGSYDITATSSRVTRASATSSSR